MKLPVSLLNRVPEQLASRFRNRGVGAELARRLVRRLMTSDEVIAVVRAGHGRGIKLLLDPKSEKYYWAGQHDVAVQDVLTSVLAPGMVFWDVGAHVGFFAVLGSRLVGSTGRVHAFEPMRDNYRRLREGVLLNEAGNVTLHETAVSGVGGRAVLHRHAASAMWTLVPERGTAAGQTVITETVDGLARELGDPDVIKIDVEGAELDVLRGALGTIERSNPVLIVEFATDESVQEGRALLPQHRFRQLSELDWLLASERESE